MTSITLKRWSSNFLLPFMVLSISAVLIWQAPALLQLLKEPMQKTVALDALQKAPFIFFSLCFLMGWRYGNLGLALAGVGLFFSYLAVSAQDATRLYATMVMILLPLHFALFSTLTNRWVITPLGLGLIALLALESGALIFLLNGHGSFSRGFVPEAQKALESVVRLSKPVFDSLPSINVETALRIVGLIISLAALLVKLFKKNDALAAAFLGAMIASLLGARHAQTVVSSSIHFCAAGFILIAGAVEVTFLKSAVDELTGLPARRSLNKALLNVGRRYTVAMIDIDHFKKFNDRYGHETGDQALRKVASCLSSVKGRAKVFRYGGEEFTALFPAQSIEESLPKLEEMRKEVEGCCFMARKAERRKSGNRGGKPRPSGAQRVRITVSIGAATSEDAAGGPDAIMRKADKKLYAAKKAGRNRVKW